MNPADFPQPFFLLARDPAIHDELQLSAEQRDRLLQASYQLDAEFWPLRGGTREQALRGLEGLTARLREAATKVLNETQMRRLEQIQLQFAGFNAFLQPQVVASLGLTKSQQADIQRVLDKFRKEYGEFEKRAKEGEDAQQLNTGVERLRSQLRSDLAGLLSQRQKQKWQLQIGNPVDLSKLGKVKFRAPELAGGPWLNSPSLTFEALQGRVVAMHFFAFQCINCRRNQPWYKDWHADLQDEGLVVLGIHTPETATERDVALVRENAKQNGLAYPILIDNDKANWSSWGNSMWPTTYLIDKQGYVRYWWLGELNWQNAGMQEQFKSHLRELLAE
ncbi:MAG: redoxin domain-containing protein [Planctomycetales bacterium]|nr:redoxin domain-containing protein [Planctomycetales bacterium]MCA9227706.1 redoxin domain-containing protein [Planctomycetales bacterium]